MVAIARRWGNEGWWQKWQINTVEKKGNQAEDLTLRWDNGSYWIRSRGKKETTEWIRKRIKSMIWGLTELAGEISAGASVLHCDYWYHDRKPWSVTILWPYFHPHVVDLEKAEPSTPLMLKHLFLLAFCQHCIQVYLFYIHASFHPHFEQKIKK